MSMSPAIRGWQNQPPPGGWAITYTLPGTDQKWTLSGLPNKIVLGISEVQKANNIFEGYGVIWDYCNAIWTARDPARALAYRDSVGVQQVAAATAMSRSTARAKVSVGCTRCG